MEHPRPRDLGGAVLRLDRSRDRCCQALGDALWTPPAASLGAARRWSRLPGIACALVAQLDRALDYESRGQEFESLLARHSRPGPGPPQHSPLSNMDTPRREPCDASRSSPSGLDAPRFGRLQSPFQGDPAKNFQAAFRGGRQPRTRMDPDMSLASKPGYIFATETTSVSRLRRRGSPFMVPQRLGRSAGARFRAQRWGVAKW